MGLNIVLGRWAVRHYSDDLAVPLWPAWVRLLLVVGLSLCSWAAILSYASFVISRL